MITVSIVSHGHGDMVSRLIRQLLNTPEISSVILTLNVTESLVLPVDKRITVLENSQPLGFGANHNAAFRQCETPFFCVLNPDIELIGNPLRLLSEELNSSDAGLCAPLVLNSGGAEEDSVREFITPWRMVLRKLGVASGNAKLSVGESSFCPDWVAGMFMLFKTEAFRRVNGFDESYFMYCEDVDICTRLWQAGLPVLLCPKEQVIHHAQRASRRDLRHLRWHLVSMFRYFARYWGRLPRTPRPL